MMRIDTLLEKYFRAETSSEEENELKIYFASDLVDEKHKAYTALFGLFALESSEMFPAPKESKKKKVKLKTWAWASGIAASLLLLTMLINPNQRDEETFIVINGNKTYDRDLAVEHVDKQLAHLAQIMNNALSPIAEAEENVEKNLTPLRKAEAAIKNINNKNN